VDYAVNVWILLEDLVKVLFFPDVDMIERWALAADKFNSIERLFRGIVEVVGDDDFETGFEQGEGGEGANVAGAPTFVSIGRPIKYAYLPGDEH